MRTQIKLETIKQTSFTFRLTAPDSNYSSIKTFLSLEQCIASANNYKKNPTDWIVGDIYKDEIEQVRLAE